MAEQDESDEELEATLDAITGRKDRPRYQLVRSLFLRLLGFVYAMALLNAAFQLPALIGPSGLLPAGDHLALLRETHGSTWSAFLERPTSFFLTGTSDLALALTAWIGLALAVAVALGAENALLMALLFGTYMSIVHVGQVFYGYGWEILLLEAGFLAIFLCPVKTVRARDNEQTPELFIWLLRWLCFRVMFGAGLIKMRGDDCWRDLSCLVYHYETQPLPNPLSPLLHAAPRWFHEAGVAFNHFVELIAPFFLFGPRRVRYVGGALIIVFQGMLIVSGNLSFLNWLTLTTAVAAFDDELLLRLLPARFRPTIEPPPKPSMPRRGVLYLVFTLLALLSASPIMNMLSFDQQMNRSFDRLHLMNTYGAFGTVNRERLEVVIEGTRDDPEDPAATWLAYELPCKPGDPDRAPCIRAPYHDRLDWQMWFAAMSTYEREPWIVHLVYQLLTGRGRARELLEHDPFPDEPPHAIRARLFRYRFARGGEPGWWHREALDEDYLVPLTADDPRLLEFVRAYGWE